MTSKCLLILSVSVSLVFSACGAKAPQPTAPILTVFAASSLTEAFTALAIEFESQHPNVDVVFNFAGSQTLRTQIEQGAAADVFASANQEEMDALLTAGFVEESKVFAMNGLVVIVPLNNPGNIESLQDLARPGLKLVLAAADVPVGKYLRQSLEKMNASFGANFSDRVLANTVSNEDNAKQVAAKVQLGEADAGIVYVTDAQGAVQRIEIPAEFNIVAHYPIAALKASQESALAQDFVVFVLSTKGQAILAKWGFRN